MLYSITLCWLLVGIVYGTVIIASLPLDPPEDPGNRRLYLLGWWSGFVILCVVLWPICMLVRALRKEE